MLALSSCGWYAGGGVPAVNTQKQDIYITRYMLEERKFKQKRFKIQKHTNNEYQNATKNAFHYQNKKLSLFD